MRIYLSPDVVVDEQEPVIPVGNRHTIWNVFAPAKFPNRAHFFHTTVLLRIAIARAFLKDAPILLLDEATAALDRESEEAIREALAPDAGHTVIAIAHRLATLRNFDRVVMLHGGQIQVSIVFVH